MEILYHGSNHIIEKPIIQGSKRNNDYGYGFYCTKSFDLAGEWASKSKGEKCIVNKYSIDLDNLRVLDLTESKYSILNWLAILLENRLFTLTSPISIQAKEYILKNFSVDISNYDVIKGYRADDSYFSFAEDFLNNTISVQHLSKAMKLGKLGVQYVLISQQAFDVLKYEGGYEINKDKYFNLFTSRDLKARNDYASSKIDLSINSDDLYVRDIIREEIKNGDTRL